jgi:hypothetical protein
MAADSFDFKQRRVMRYGDGHPNEDEVMAWLQLIRSWL